MLQKAQAVFLLCLSRSKFFFINSVSVCAGLLCSPFCDTSFNCMFQRFSILCFEPKFVLLNKIGKVACGNRSGLNCKYGIPCGVAARSNSILYLHRLILIRSYNERKLQQGVKQKYFKNTTQNFIVLCFLILLFYILRIATSHQICQEKNDIIIANYYVIQW